MTQKTLAGKWAVILGVSSGLGAAIARELASHGANIFGLYLGRGKPSSETQAFAESLAHTHGVHMRFVRANMASDDKRGEAIALLKETLAAQPATEQSVHVLVHSVAFGSLAPFLHDDPTQALTRAQLEMTLDVMANSLLYWVQDLWRAKLFVRGSRVFSMSSAGSQQVVRNYGAVSAAKAALEAYTRQLAAELAPHGVAVNAIMAGVADTSALRKIPTHEEIVNSALRRNPSRRLTTPEDVAIAVRALCDPALQWITGATIPVDGGEIFCM
jgi:NAD(P)-dependent dehydrogenase (short-subunit alcohol dehydrogenase family)